MHRYPTRLVNTDLKNADLSSASLSGAYLNGTILRNANLTDIKLNGAVIQASDFRGATLKNADFRGAGYDDKTLWDEEYNPQLVGMNRIPYPEEIATQKAAESRLGYTALLLPILVCSFIGIGIWIAENSFNSMLLLFIPIATGVLAILFIIFKRLYDGI
jgi:hypothetical protein